MKPNGWIRDYRQELESDVWKMPPLYHRVWQWLKYQVNRADGKIPLRDGTFIEIKRGKKLTSYRQIAEGVGWYDRGVWRTPNPKTIKAVLDWLVTHGNISLDESNSKYTVITICNYSLYQPLDIDESNTQETVGKQSLDTNNKDNKDDKNKNDSLKDLRIRFDQFWSSYPKKKSKGDAEKAWNIIRPSEQLLADMLTALKRATTSAQWMREKGEFIPYPATWLRAKGWLDEQEDKPNGAPQTNTPANTTKSTKFDGHYTRVE